MLKICTRCKEEKPISKFYLHKEMADGYLSICKSCTIVRVGKHRRKNLAKIRKKDRIRGRTEKRLALARARAKRPSERVRYREYKSKSF